MSKCFFFLSIILSTSSLIIGMERNIPKLGRITHVDSHPCHPQTPRNCPVNVETAAFHSQMLNSFINDKRINQTISLIQNSDRLNSYGPRTALIKLINGEVAEPFESKESWVNYTPSGIKKDRYKDTCLEILVRQIKNSDNEEAEKLTKIYYHIENITN